jgi:predicted nucleic acid-binding protein
VPARCAVVVDSDVWISALVFGGALRHVFEMVVRDALRLVVSAEILTEIRRAVVGKFPDFVWLDRIRATRA